MKILTPTSFLLFFLVFAKLSFAQILYVQTNGTGDGSSWATSANLQTALATATAGTQLWLAQGKYIPTSCNSCNSDDRRIYFQIPSDVALYGGFTGTETSLVQRDWTNNKTILSGDINQDNVPNGNSYTIIYTEYVTAATIVDGITISNANADWLINGHGGIENTGGAWYNDGSLEAQGSHPTIRNCTFKDNRAQGFAAAMFNKGNLGGAANPTYENCIFDNNNAAVGGAALYNLGSTDGESSPSITNCQFLNNFSEFDGGAISNVGIDNGLSSPIISNCYFEGNHSSKHGGAIHNFGKTGLSSPTISDCQFHDNFGDIGGAIYNDGTFFGQSHPEIKNCTFTQNEAGSAGAAIYNLGADNGNCSPILYNLVVRNNHSQGAGAGIFNNAIQGICNPTITNCIVLSNVADTYGGGIYNLGKGGDCSPTLTNCLVAKNSGLSAGGMYCLGSEGGNSSPTVTNCTFYGNSALVGGGIYCNASDLTGNSSPLIRNTIIYGNTADFGSVFRCIYGTPTIENCLVDKPDCLSLNSGVGSNVTCSTGVLFDIDPMFMSTDTDDFHLQPVSPLLDMGSNTAILQTGISIDLDSTMRINNGVVDLGVYEYNAVQYVPPSLLAQPTDITECAGQTIEFSVSATGTPPLIYQWQKNGEDILNENLATLLIDNISDLDDGTYRCQISSIQGDMVLSDAASLLVNPTVDASLEVASTTTSICSGELVEFSSVSTNEGDAAVFNWIINGMSTGVSTTTFASSELQDGDIVGCILNASAACVQNNPVISNAITMSVAENISPSVSIESSATEICAGEAITFSAMVNNMNLNESYQWQINGENVGTNAATFTSSNLEQDDVVTCSINSDAPCLSTNMAVSNAIEILIHPVLTPTVAITSSADSFCAGEMVNFTAMTSEAGNNPLYQWQVNGENVGQNLPAFSSSDLQNGATVVCQITATGDCLTQTTANSNPIELNVTSQVTPAIEIEASTQEICAGMLVSFSAQANNTGDNPAYQWQVNGENVGDNSPAFESDNLPNNANVTCLLTSNSSCVTDTEAVSNTLEIIVLENLEANLFIEASTQEVCAGTLVSFSAQANNTGDTPTYQWQINGENVGDNSPAFESDNLPNNANVTCLLTSSGNCINASTVNSNSIEMVVHPILNASIELDANMTNICAGEMVNFTSVVSNAGTNPTYQWQINGENVGENSPFFSSATLQHNDEISCTLISDANCIAVAQINAEAITVAVTATVTPDVNITVSEMVSCYGDELSFTANTTNGGDNPQLDWYWNGNFMLSNQLEFNTSGLNDGDEIQCVLTSSASCLSMTSDSSNVIAVQIDALDLPTIAVTTSDENPCVGDPVLFSTLATNMGDSPVYEWFVNGTSIGILSDSLTLNDLSNGDEIQCLLTSNADCLLNETALSNTWTIEISEQSAAAVAVVFSNEMPCIGEMISLTADALNGGSSPTFTWYVNGDSVSNQQVFETNILSDQDEIYVSMTSSATCVQMAQVDSEVAQIGLLPLQIPSAEIEVDETIELLCEGDTLIFRAMTFNAGTTPQFDWLVNGVSSGATTSIFMSDSLQENDILTCQITADEACVSTAAVLSNEIDIVFDANCTNATNDIYSKLQMALSPNPTNGIFRVQLLDYTKAFNLEIYTSTGLLMFTQTVTSYHQSQIVDLTDLPAGIYVVQASNTDFRLVERVVLE